MQRTIIASWLIGYKSILVSSPRSGTGRVCRRDTTIASWVLKSFTEERCYVLSSLVLSALPTIPDNSDCWVPCGGRGLVADAETMIIICAACGMSSLDAGLTMCVTWYISVQLSVYRCVR